MNMFKLILRDELIKSLIEQTQQKQQEYVLVKRERKIPGHTLFSYNIITKEIKIAPIQYSKDIDFMTREPLHKPKINIEPNCIYRQALNKKNFIKRLKREGVL